MTNDEEHDAFRQAMRGVKPLQVAGQAPGQKPQPRRPRARFARAERAAVLADSLAVPADPLAPVIESGEEISWRGPRISPAIFRRLRRGDYRVDAELDLHGLTQLQARTALAAFLAEAIDARLRVVRIVHGKGLRSGTRGPVLRTMVNESLRKIAAVLAFASAREVDGGTGACLVLLAKPAGLRPRR